MSKALAMSQFLNRKFKTLPFEGEWADLIGEPEVAGNWFIWANSGNGKTTFAAQLAKYLSTFGRVAYNSIEEGISGTLQTAFINAGIQETDNILLLDKESIDDLKIRLRKRKSARFNFVDSVQFTGLNKNSYLEFVEEFPHKVFIWLSHADGKKPSGRTADFIHYHSNVKLWVEGYKVFPKSRYYGGGDPYIVWTEGADKYWLE